MSIKKFFSFALVLLILVSILPQRASAAGIRFFDFENSDNEQIYAYLENIDGEWSWELFANYDYYPNGTIKAVRSNYFGWDYEGHYDPHGHLMDPSIIYCIGDGYTEGLALGRDAQPVRKYDEEGKLIHFEALRNDAHGSYMTWVDYEYDDHDRISRVYYEYEIPDDSDSYDSIIRVSPACSVFEYSDDGTYRIISVLAIPEEGYSYWRTFSYDANHRLVFRETFSYGMDFQNERVYSGSEELYTYDEDGFLTRYQHFDYYSSELDSAAELVEDWKYEYHWADEQTLLCDMSYREDASEEYEESDTRTYVFDKIGRIIKDEYREYCYDLTDDKKIQG